MKRIALALILLAAFPGAWAEEWVARHGSDEVRLSEAPCTNAGILAQIGKSDESETFHAGSAIQRGKHFALCWQAEDDGNVWLRYEDADQGILPMSLFKRAPSI